MIFVIDGEPKSTEYVAKQIHLVWVTNASKKSFDLIKKYIKQEHHDRLVKRTYLYCEASVIRVIFNTKVRDSRYQELLHEFETLLFANLSTSDFSLKGQLLKSAISDLDQIFLEKSPFSWCREWFRNVGHSETNPAVLTLLFQFLALDTNSLGQLIQDIGPPCKQ